MLLDKVFIWTIYKKAFRLKGQMLSVSSRFISHDFLLSFVPLWSSFAFVCKNYISLSTTKSDMFFYCPSYQRLGGGQS